MTRSCGLLRCGPGEDDGDVVVPVIDIRGLHKTYGPVVAVDGVDLSVAPADTQPPCQGGFRAVFP